MPTITATYTEAFTVRPITDDERAKAGNAGHAGNLAVVDADGMVMFFVDDIDEARANVRELFADFGDGTVTIE